MGAVSNADRNTQGTMTAALRRRAGASHLDTAIASRSTYPRFPVWTAASWPAGHAPSDALRTWLIDTSSLTRRLRAASSGNFRVVMLSQRLARPTLDEATVLRMRQGVWAMVREVILTCEERSCVYARTVVPANTLRRSRRRLLYLKERPLGELLFGDPAIFRERVEFGKVVRGQRLFERMRHLVPADGREVWGRRSLFRFEKQPLLVSEFFLPGFHLWRYSPE